MIALLLLTACGGPADDTLIDELRVVSVVPDRPEVAPGDAVTVLPVVADPEGTGADVLVWTCTDLGEGCLEAQAPVATFARVVGPGDAVTLVAPPIPVPASGLPTTVWVAACAPGLCPVIDDVLAAPTDAPPDRALARDLADPSRWLADLPFHGVSVASKLVWLTETPSNANPALSPRFDAVLAAPGDEVRLGFDVADDDLAGARSWAFTTGGAFEGTDQDAATGRVRWTWFAPDDPGRVTLYVAVDDGAGGTALWQGTATVR